MAATKVLKVSLKHGKVKHKAVELDMDTLSLEALQGIVFSLTQVPPQRQKIILKGKQIESDKDLARIKNKAVLTVMGSAEQTSALAHGVQFVEDMTDAQKQEANAALPPGLYNLGNTCYLNSTLQCMKGIEELRDSVSGSVGVPPARPGVPGVPPARPGVPGVPGTGFVNSLGNLFSEMNGNSDAVNPVSFVQDFRTRFPEFSTRNEQGAWEQQDAEECLTKLLSTIKAEGTADGMPDIDSLFAGQFETEMKCVETEDEPTVAMQDTFLKLRCFIDAETRHIAFGIQKSMKEEITKRSKVLNRNALWVKTQRISKLPKYLTVSMVRFFWKQSKQKNAKILRSVQFDTKLDVTNFCNDKLKQAISSFRKKKMEAEDALREKRQKQGISLKGNESSKDDSTSKAQSHSNSDQTADTEMNGNKEKEKEKEKEEKKGDGMEIDGTDDGDAGGDAGGDAHDESGFYELIGLITHKGLSANSGHYIGYSKDSKRGWLKFDDEIVTEVTEDDIKKLYGGGQWQMGYVCFYRKMAAIIPSEDREKEKRK